jgi:predicted nucleotidyltransferase
MCNQTTLNIITSHIVQITKDSLGDKLDKLILFGSYARGDYDEESDIDIMVLADIPRKDCWNERMKISKLTGWLDLEYDVLISLHVTDCATFYKYINDLPFYINVRKNGVTLSA